MLEQRSLGSVESTSRVIASSSAGIMRLRDGAKLGNEDHEVERLKDDRSSMTSLSG